MAKLRAEVVGRAQLHAGVESVGTAHFLAEAGMDQLQAGVVGMAQLDNGVGMARLKAELAILAELLAGVVGMVHL
jgi:hypothetical protein